MILAAGGSRRLGRSKQLLTIAGETLVARVTRLVLDTRPSRTLVLIGAEAGAVALALEGHDVELVVNDRWETGMASSLNIAAEQLADSGRSVLVTVVDQPALATRHLVALLAAHTDDRDTVTAYGDTLGVPAVLRASTFARASHLRGDTGFRHLWAASAPLAVRADELVTDLDDEADVNRAAAAGLLDSPDHRG